MLPSPPPSPSPTSCPSQLPESRIGLLLADRIQLVEVLGHGAYGCVVYKAIDIHTGAPFAVKALNKLGLDARQKTFHEREIRLHQQASCHPNVVSMYMKVDFPDCLFVILEYCAGGDLFVNITDKAYYVGNDALAKSAFLQLLDAVEYCHSIGIYHRDLKPENVLLSEDGITVKLADFGLATTDRLSTDFGCGSTFYMSPECQQPSPKPFSSYESAPNDIWSLGVVLVNLACGRNPWKRAFAEDSTFNAFLKDAHFLKSILPLTHELDYILRRIFEVDPSRRITLSELRELILVCPAFTTIPSSYPSPPYQPVGFSKTSFDNSSVEDFNNFQLAPEHQSFAYSTRAAPSGVISAQSSQHSAASSSAFSNGSPVFSPSPSPPIPSQRDVVYTTPHNQQHDMYGYAQPTSTYSSTWYSSFMPAFDLAQKHVTFQPFFSNVRMF